MNFINEISKMNKCPLCGREVNLSIKAGTPYNNGMCIDYSAEITCECGLSLESEWTKMRAKDGYILRDEDIFTVWNRLTGIKEELEALKQAHLAAEKRNAELAEENERAKLEFAGFEEGTKHVLKKLTEENERLRAKQIPQKPLKTRREIICPSCRTLVGSRPYCGYCGQAIDWSKESEGE